MMKQLELPPLQEPTFFILLTLAQGPRHGYAILQDVAAFSEGRVRLSTGTLYGALSRLLDQALIERVDEDEPPADEKGTDDDGVRNGHPGRARKTYRLTRAGRGVLRAATARMQALVAVAHRQLGEQPAG